MSEAWRKIKCWWRHRFNLVGYTEIIKGNWLPGNAWKYVRRCERCGLTQEIGVCYGIHFNDKEYFS
jgi:hypothetical protein